MTFSATQADFRASIAQAEEWQMAAAYILRQLGDPTPQHRLGIVYVSSTFSPYLSDIEVFLRQTTGVPHWVGCAGHGVLSNEAELFETPAMAAMLCPVTEDGFHVFKDLHKEEDVDNVVQEAAAWLSQVDVPLALVHGDPGNEEIPGLIQDLAIESSAFLVGGLTSTVGKNSQLADGAEGDGLSGVMFSNRITPMITGITQACVPIGPIHHVSDSEKNILLQLDDRPSLEVFKEDIDEPFKSDLEKIAGNIFAGLPIEGSDKGDYLIRNIMAIDPAQNIMAIGAELDAGEEVIFCQRDPILAEENLRNLLKDLRKRAGTSPIKGGIYINCAGRGPNLFGDDISEIDVIKDELGDFPLVGFYANGEISFERLYTYTGVLTLFL